MHRHLMLALLFVFTFASTLFAQPQARVLEVSDEDRTSYLACLEIRLTIEESKNLALKRFGYAYFRECALPTSVGEGIDALEYYIRLHQRDESGCVYHLYVRPNTSTQVFAFVVGSQYYPIAADSLTYGSVAAQTESQCGLLRKRTKGQNRWSESLKRRALEASVRISTPDCKGTGVIIETPEAYRRYLLPEELLVATAAHVTPAYYKSNGLQVELFDYSDTYEPSVKATRTARIVVSGQSFGSDVALVAFSPRGIAVTPVPLAEPERWFSATSEYFCVGCPKGNDPHFEFTKAVRADVLLSTVYVEKTSESGESGGGMFDTDGCLIGLCSAVFREPRMVRVGTDLLDPTTTNDTREEHKASVFTQAPEVLLSKDLLEKAGKQTEDDIQNVLLRLTPETRQRLEQELQRARIDRQR